MLFVIQHTQSRHQAATQRKLDEILLALPEANNAILSIENAADEELQLVAETHAASREEALRESYENDVTDD
jgi:low affinity Fe/Cu permease